MRRLVLLALALCLLAPTAALASGDDVIEDCADDNELSRPYSQAEYKKALQDIPADLDEYTSCRDIIRRARLRGAGGRSTGGGNRAPRKISKRKRDQIKHDLESKQLAAAGPLDIGGTLVDPDSLESSSTIPAPLVVVLVLVALAAIAGGGLAIRKLVIGRRDK